MDEIYTNLNKAEFAKTLIAKYGVADTLRFYMTDVRSAVNGMKVGVAENNEMMALQHLSELDKTVTAIEALISNKENKAALNVVKKTTKKK